MHKHKEPVVHKTRLKKGDKVQVISGKNKGEVGEIQLVNRKKGWFYVEGVNLQTKHAKPNQNNQKGGIFKKEGPVHFSNVLLWNEKAGKGQRFHMSTNKAGEKIRVFTTTKK